MELPKGDSFSSRPGDVAENVISRADGVNQMKSRPRYEAVSDEV